MFASLALVTSQDSGERESMTDFKVGDRVRLTGVDWGTYDEDLWGNVVEIDHIDRTMAPWAGNAGSIGNRYGLYSPENPEGSGDYSVELVENSRLMPPPPVTSEQVQAIAALGGQLETFEQNVRRHLDKIGDLLVAKNKSYGDAALNPIRVFSRADRLEQLSVRIDDKLSRIQRGTEFEDEDTVRDLAGYLVMLLIARESE